MTKKIIMFSLFILSFILSIVTVSAADIGATLYESGSDMYNLYGADYEVIVDYIDSTGAKFKVNGAITPLLPIGGTWNELGYVELNVVDIVIVDGAAGIRRVDFTLTVLCIDTDGGKDIYKKGTASKGAEKNTDTCNLKVWNGVSYQYNLVTSCTGVGCYVNEGICQENTISGKELIKCPSGCSNGVCSEPAECTDSDVEDDIYVKGTATFSDDRSSVSDSCEKWNGYGGTQWIEVSSCSAAEAGNSNDPEVGSCFLRQVYCNEVDTPSKSSFDFVCPNGCQDGACVEPETKSDLAVNDIYYYGDYYIKVKYCNIGSGSSNNDFLIELRNEDNGKEYKGNSYYRFSVPNPGECATTGGFTCGLIGVSCGDRATISATIDWEQRVAESNENNNKLTKTIGDLGCEDSDGGINYYVKGKVYSPLYDVYGGYKEDVCSNNLLMEYYCSGNDPQSRSYTCPNGCQEGACKDTISPTTAINSPPANSLQNTDFSVSATDSDSGSGLDVCYYHVADEGKGFTVSWQTRNCNSPFTVTVGPGKNCETIGENKCLVYALAKDKAGNVGPYDVRHFNIGLPEEEECTDSDGGKNYYAKGVVKTATGGGEDYCGITNSPNSLGEYFCDGGVMALQPYICEYGCEEGACISSKVLPPFTMTVDDMAPASDVILISDVAVSLKYKGYTIPAGYSKLFSEVNGLLLNYKVTLAVYSGEAVIIVGANSPSSHVTFALELEGILKNKGIAPKKILSNEVPSANLLDLFETSKCTETDNGLDQFTKGVTKGKKLGSSQTIWTDNCVSSSRLTEYYCLDGGVANTFPICTLGCKDGACIRPGSSTDKPNLPIDLSNYPNMFIKNGKLNTILVVGDHASANHVIAASDIAVSLNFATESTVTTTGTATVTKIDVGAIKLASEIPDPKKLNIISIGGPCANAVSTQLMGNPADCTKGFTRDKGIIKLYNYNGYAQLIVAGYSDQDTRKTASVLANWQDYDLDGMEDCVYGTRSNPIVKECEQASTCTDSDGGKNYYTAGKLYWGGKYIGSDYCIDDTKMHEYYCQGNSYGGTTQDCTYGCSDGACVGKLEDIEVRLNQEFDLMQKQYATVVNYKNMKIKLNSIITECFDVVASTQSTSGSSASSSGSGGGGGGGVGCNLIGAHVQVEMPMNCVTTSPSHDCTNSAVGFIIKTGQSREAFGAVINLEALRHDKGTFIVRKSTQEDYVDVLIEPRIETIKYGDYAEYEITVVDKHPRPKCLDSITAPCSFAPLTYQINVRNLPFLKEYLKQITVGYGESKSFTLVVKPYQIIDVEEIVEEETEESIEVSKISEEAVAAEEGRVIVRPYYSRQYSFNVEASLKGNPKISDIAYATLRIVPPQIVSPPQFPSEEISIGLYRGWNLVSIPGKLIQFESNGGLTRKLLGFVYLKDQQKYVTLKEAQGILGSDFREYLATNAFWIYSYTDYELKIKIDKEISFDEIELSPRWNLIPITEDMVGGYLGDIKGDCNFEKIYKWNAVKQTWEKLSETYEFKNSEVNRGLIIKAEDYCTMSGVTITSAST